MVVIVGSVEREVEVLRADDVVVDSELDTFVGGLTHVLVLVRETAGLVDRHLHKEVLRIVPVEIQATVDTSVEEAEVDTEVTADGRLPLQIGVTFHLTRYIDGLCLAVDGDRTCCPGLTPEGC